MIILYYYLFLVFYRGTVHYGTYFNYLEAIKLLIVNYFDVRSTEYFKTKFNVNVNIQSLNLKFPFLKNNQFNFETIPQFKEYKINYQLYKNIKSIVKV